VEHIRFFHGALQLDKKLAIAFVHVFFKENVPKKWHSRDIYLPVSRYGGLYCYVILGYHKAVNTMQTLAAVSVFHIVESLELLTVPSKAFTPRQIWYWYHPCPLLGKKLAQGHLK